MDGPTLPILARTQADSQAGFSLMSSLCIVNWVFFSSLTILFNKWLIDNAGFRYPVILTLFHMAFASLATQILATTTRLLDTRHKIKMTKKRYMRAVVPIAVFYSGSLVCSNLVYLYMSLAFIQIVKNAAPFTTLIIAWLWGLEQPTGTTILKVLIIVFGIGLASLGDIHFSWVGLLYSCGGLLFESIRVVLVQELLQGNGVNMDPLVGLYYYAPISAITNLFIAWVTEWPSFNGSAVAQAGVTMLALNAFIAFFLNVASMMVIGKTSGLVLHLTGVLKNILLVVTAALIWSTPITSVQILGYSISLIGFVLYKLK